LAKACVGSVSDADCILGAVHYWRVLRGGSWNNDNPNNLRAANRNRNNPENRNDNNGFRGVALRVLRPSEPDVRCSRMSCLCRRKRGRQNGSRLEQSSQMTKPPCGGW
jgi:hypothetical protein